MNTSTLRMYRTIEFRQVYFVFILLCFSNTSAFAQLPAPELELSTTELNLITLSWTSVPGALGYELLKSSDPDGEVKISELGNRTSLSVTLWKDTTFFVAIRAYNYEGNGELSNVEYLKLEGTSLPKIPRGIISNGKKGKPISQKIIDHPFVTGFIVLNAWKDVEYEEGQYDWNHIDSEIERAKAAGKVVRIAIHTGGKDVPYWVRQNYPEIKEIFVYDKITREQIWIPAYWDHIFLNIKARFYRAIGNRYKNEPTVFAISVAMVDPNTGDWAFKIENNAQKQAFLEAGFSETAFIIAYKRLINVGMRAFKNKYVTTAVGPISTKLVDDQFYAVHKVLDYAFDTYSNRLIILKGSLHAKIPAPYDDTDNRIAWKTMLRYMSHTAAQMVWSVTKDPMYRMNGKQYYSPDEIPSVFTQAIENANKYHINWIEPFVIDILNPDLQDELEYAAWLISAN